MSCDSVRPHIFSRPAAYSLDLFGLNCGTFEEESTDVAWRKMSSYYVRFSKGTM